ncbi:sulfite exporter TauE/SafE family protein [bacterium BMS3Abin03]|nr:sulfite exporter TauE/SafE family protein [bacterium BMS3Abin03]MCG6961434.1 sulfite exporter TauE/SafE family protein [bacterium BMS3Abin03]
MNVFNINLPVVGVQFNILILVLIGFCVGVIAGFFGEGGGWFVTPALNIFGFPMAYAIGTCLSNIFGQSIGATKRHQRMGNIDWKLGLISVTVSIVGFEIGSQVVLALEKTGNAGNIIRWCYVVFLSGLSCFMFYDYFVLQKRQLNDENEIPGTPVEDIQPCRSKIAERLYIIKLPPMISFPISQIKAVSLWIIIAIFLCTGFCSGLLGIGGGFIIMPTLIYLIGLPTIIAVGTSLITVLFSSAYGCFIYAVNGRVELVAAVILLIGASIGVQIGATAVKYIKGYGIRLLFAIMIAFAALSVITEQFYKMTGKSFFQTMAEIILLGTALIITTIILSKLYIEIRKERGRY